MTTTYEALLDHRLLTLDEEIALGHRIQAGDKDALGELVRHNLRLVHSIARKYHGVDEYDPAMQSDDLMQIGIMGLIHAAQKYDPDRGLRFSTYATNWVRQYISRAGLTSGPIRRTANPYYEPVRPHAVRAHALRQAPVARLDAPLRDRHGDDSQNTLADILADDCISVEDRALSSIEVERIIAKLRLNERGEAIIRDWLAGVPRDEAQQMHGVSRSWIYTTLKDKKARIPMPMKHTTCIEPGCDQPRHVSSKGTVLPRCHEHQKQFWREIAAANRHPNAPPPEQRRPRGRHRKSQAATPPSDSPLPMFGEGPGGGVSPSHEEPGLRVSQGGEDCTCPDCIYREVVSLLAARNPRIEELVQAVLTARRLRDDLGI